MEKIGISELRANLTVFLRKVEQGKVITITLRGVEVAQLVPPEYTQESARKTLAQLRQTATVGDVLSPIEEEWESVE